MEEGHTKGAETALAAGASVDGPLLQIACPFTQAVLCDQASMVILLIENGANVDAGVAKDIIADGIVALAKGSQPLHVAAQRRDRNIIGLLLQSGAAVNATDAYGSTPQLTSCRFCAVPSPSTSIHAAVGRELLGAGADVTLADNACRIALHYAAVASDDMDLIDLLVSPAPETLNRVDCEGKTPLCAAAQVGNTNSVRCLLSAGATQPTPTHEQIKCSLMMAAVEIGHGGVVHVLLDEGMEALDGPVMHDAIVGAVAQRRAAILHALLRWGEENLQ